MAWGELNSRWARWGFIRHLAGIVHVGVLASGWGFIRHLAGIAHVGVLASGSAAVSASCPPTLKGLISKPLFQ